MYKYNIKMSIENDLHELTDQSEIESYCNNIYKNWIVDVIDDYAIDYSILKKSWNQICEAIKMDPKKIITVSHLPIDTKDPDYINIHTMADVLSSKITKERLALSIASIIVEKHSGEEESVRALENSVDNKNGAYLINWALL